MLWCWSGQIWYDFPDNPCPVLVFNVCIALLCAQGVSVDAFLEGMVEPCLRHGSLRELLEQMHNHNPTMQQWMPYIMGTCRYLAKKGMHNSLYNVQIFVKVWLSYHHAVFFCQHSAYRVVLVIRLWSNLQTMLAVEIMSSSCGTMLELSSTKGIRRGLGIVVWLWLVCKYSE